MADWLARFAKQSLIGVDIGSTGIKLLELSRRGEAFQLLSFVKVSYPYEQMLDPHLPDEAVVVATLQEALEKLNSKNRQAAVAINSATVISRPFDAPAELTEQGLELYVRQQADQLIPYSLEEVQLDYAPTGPVNEREETRPMMLVAARRDQVDMQVRLLTEAGLDCRLVDVDTYAIGRSLNYSLKKQRATLDGLIGLLDIGAIRSVLYVYEGERLVYSREHDFGDHQLSQPPNTSTFDFELEVDEDEQDSFQHQQQEYSYANVLAQQTERALILFQEAQPDSQLSMLVLAGGGGCREGLAEPLSKQLNVEVRHADPLAGIQVPAKLEKLIRPHAAALMTAAGLAMRAGREWGS